MRRRVTGGRQSRRREKRERARSARAAAQEVVARLRHVLLDDVAGGIGVVGADGLDDVARQAIVKALAGDPTFRGLDEASQLATKLQ